MEGAGSVGLASTFTTVSNSIGLKLKTTSEGEVEDSFCKKAEVEGKKLPPTASEIFRQQLDELVPQGKEDEDIQYIEQKFSHEFSME